MLRRESGLLSTMFVSYAESFECVCSRGRPFDGRQRRSIFRRNNVMVRPILTAFSLAVALCFTVSAAEQTFVFGKHGPKHTNMVINSQTDLESITTTTN